MQQCSNILWPKTEISDALVIVRFANLNKMEAVRKSACLFGHSWTKSGSFVIMAEC